MPAKALAEIPQAAVAPQAAPETASGQALPEPSLSAAPDTVYAVEPALEMFDTPPEKHVFIPKGQWVAGVSINYTQSNQNNYQFLILEGISGDSYTFKVSPMACYVFRDDMGAGGKFAYSRALTKIEKASVVLDSETGYDLDNLYMLSHSYSAMGIFRNYFGLGGSKRFGFFNEVQLLLGGGQSKIMQGKGAGIIGSYSRDFNFNIGIAPGLIVFLNNYSALEVNVGVLGFNYSHRKVISNQVKVAHFKTQSANFRINLFSITFGMAFYI